MIENVLAGDKMETPERYHASFDYLKVPMAERGKFTFRNRSGDRRVAGPGSLLCESQHSSPSEVHPRARSRDNVRVVARRFWWQSK